MSTSFLCPGPSYLHDGCDGTRIREDHKSYKVLDGSRIHIRNEYVYTSLEPRPPSLPPFNSAFEIDARPSKRENRAVKIQAYTALLYALPAQFVWPRYTPFGFQLGSKTERCSNRLWGRLGHKVDRRGRKNKKGAFSNAKKGSVLEMKQNPVIALSPPPLPFFFSFLCATRKQRGSPVQPKPSGTAFKRG